MNVNLKAGDIVRIENAFFKNDNALYFVDRCPGDAGWCGDYYSLKKICKNGKISKGKYTTSSWPIACLTNDRVKNAEARAWNEEHATIEVVEGINTEYVIEHFQNEAEESKGLYEYHCRRWGEGDKLTKLYKSVLEHYNDVVKRMTTNEEKAEEMPLEESTETTEEVKQEVKKPTTLLTSKLLIMQIWQIVFGNTKKVLQPKNTSTIVARLMIF